MFESLDKMVEIENNELFTLNPFAYTKCLQNIDYNENYEKNPVVLPVPMFWSSLYLLFRVHSMLCCLFLYM